MLVLMRKREEREAREAEKRELAELADMERKDFVKQARQKTEKFEWDQAQKVQSLCDHRKGTSGKGPKARHIDYDISVHTFNNGVMYVKCLKCKHKSFPGDSRELCAGTMDNFIRKGKKVPNPTKKSYNDWMLMAQEENTTNRPSTAEIITAKPTPMMIEANVS